MAKNAIVGQSGGPTSVINSSLAGVYESCKRRGAGKVYGMMHGVAGLLERRVCVLDDKLKKSEAYFLFVNQSNEFITTTYPQTFSKDIDGRNQSVQELPHACTLHLSEAGV